MDDAAVLLGVSRRFLVDTLKRHPHYERRGTKKVFYQEHIDRLGALLATTHDTHEAALRAFIQARMPVDQRQILDEWLAGQNGSLIYLVRCHERVKIGFTDNWAGRLRIMRTSCPYPVTVIALIKGSRSLELFLHHALHDLRALGEWFREEGDLRDLTTMLEKVSL